MTAKARRVLFIQATDPAVYPPLIHASTLMADAGWEVTFLAAPTANNDLVLLPHPRIKVRGTRPRPSHVMSKPAYAAYASTAAWLALTLRPDLIYASNPLGAGPALLASKLSGAALVYHEHDSPNPGTSWGILSRLRAVIARAARLVVFPNEARARLAQEELAFPPERLRIVWNLPRLSELPPPAVRPREPLVIYYHGSVTPDRLPLSVVDAVLQLSGRVVLRIAGYEAPVRGYISELVARGAAPNIGPLVEYIGQVQREDIILQAAQAHVGLAFMPPGATDINMRHMTGASNKVFDYMAAGLALLVSDMPDWNDMFVLPGYARACDISSVPSIVAALNWFIDHEQERDSMARLNRLKIADDWNYDKAFAPVLAALCDGSELPATGN